HYKIVECAKNAEQKTKKHQKPVIVQRKRTVKVKIKNRKQAKKMFGKKIRNSTSGNNTYQHGTVEIFLQFFQRKHNAGQRSVKSRGKPGAGSAGQHVPLFGRSCPGQLCGAFCCHGSQLD